MENGVTTTCHQVIKFEDKEERLQLFINEVPVYLWLVAPWALYVILNIVISAINVGNCTDALVLGLSLINYLLLLKLVSIAYSHIKSKLIEKCAQDILISCEKLSDISVFFLAFTAAYFGIIGLVEGIRSDDWSSLEVTFLTLTLYAGFTVSLDELFDKEKSPTLWYGLTKPFRRTRISASAFIGIVAIVILSILPNFWECVFFVYLVLLLIFLGVIKLLWEIRKKQLHRWGKNVSELLQDKKVLIYQLGTDSSVKHELEKTLTHIGAEIVNVDKDDFSSTRYDIVVILNSLIKFEEAIPGIKGLNAVLSDEGVIIDPFITKRKHRCMLAAGFGLPNATITRISLKDYLSLIEHKVR